MKSSVKHLVSELSENESNEDLVDDESISTEHSYDSENEADNIDNNIITEENREQQNATQKRKFEVSNEGSVKKVKTSASHSLVPPTVKELNQLRETQNLFHSNIFRLQIEEMLKEVQIKEKYNKMFQSWFEDLRSALQQIDESKNYELKNQKWLKKLKVKMPLAQKPFEVKGFFQFTPPSSVSIIGSWKLHCIVGPNAVVDICVEMPETCFQKNDYLNQRYYRKRALYLAYIAAFLKNSDLVEDIKFQHWCGSSMKPLIKLKPSGKLGKHITVQLHLSAPITALKLARFSPSKNNVRSSWYFGESDTEEAEAGPPTPHYNSNIASDLTMLKSNDYLAEVLNSHSNIRDAIILLKVWLRQRELDQGSGAFNGFIMSMYVASLCTSRRVTNAMSSYQIARCVWNTLAQSDWSVNGITLATSVLTTLPSLSEFHEQFEVVFVDTTGYCNLCADMSRETFLQVKSEAELAVKFLDNSSINSFQSLFMTHMPFYRQYDHIICLWEAENAIFHSPKFFYLDWCCQIRPQALALILPLLRRCLGSRVSAIGIQLGNIKNWDPEEEPPEDKVHIMFGLRLDPLNAFSILEKGPEANLPEAEDFKKFWGSKSELRRFQDGTISEAVVWNGGASMYEKRTICRQAVEYILSSHLEIDSESNITYIADQLESVLKIQKVKPAGFDYGTGEEATLAVLKSYDGLAHQLRLLKDLPLDISAVQGASAVFRYCEVFPPLATTHKLLHSVCTEVKNCYTFLEDIVCKKVPRFLIPVEVVITLALSGKWPNDVEAIRRIRAAFNIKISQCLQDQFNIVAQPYQDFVDVLKDGFVFRLCIAYSKEISLLKQMTTPLGLTKYRDTQDSLSLEKKVIHLPKLTSALHGLHQEYQSYGPAVCLAKRWMRSQLLDAAHVPDVAIELLVASLYTSPEPYVPPTQPQASFLRFLHRLAYTDWHMQPLIININKEMDAETLASVEKYFYSARQSLPALFIATPYDTRNSIWTKEAPSLLILIRAAALAAEALKIVEEQILSTSLFDCKQIFLPAMDLYDVLIYLNPLLNPRRSEFVNIKVEKSPFQLPHYKPHTSEKIPIVGFDPVQLYLKELRECYGDYALFFHDTFGGEVIGVLWKPVAREEKEFKVSNLKGHKLTEDLKVCLNFDAVIEEFSIMGSGLVKCVKLKCLQSSGS